MLHTEHQDGIHKTCSLYDTARYILASLDIKDAFYSIPMHKTRQQFVKFLLWGKALSFNAMPNEYVDSMEVFNKVIKPLFAY